MGTPFPHLYEFVAEFVRKLQDFCIRVVIPFDENVAATISERKNVGTNVGTNKTERKILDVILEHPQSTAEEMASQIGVTKRTIERSLKRLQEKGRIVRSGANKNGHWVVIR